MIVRLTFKTPDVLYDAICHDEYSEREQNKIRKLAERFIEYDEYLYVELDTDKGTCTVVEN